jgi:hypothetical protein
LKGEAKVVPKLKVLFYGVAGPAMSLTAGLGATLQPCRTPIWKVEGVPAQFGVELALASWFGDGLSASTAFEIPGLERRTLAEAPSDVQVSGCDSIQPDLLAPFRVGEPVDEPLWIGLESVGLEAVEDGALRWEIQQGSLPDGVRLELDEDEMNARLTGTPTETGSFGFTVRARDAFGLDLKRDYLVEVFPEALEIVTSELADASLDKPYRHAIVSNAVEPVRYRVTEGELPPGLTLGRDGVIEGTPSALGIYGFVVTAELEHGDDSDERTFAIGVNADFELVATLPASFTTSAALDVTLRIPAGEGQEPLPAANRYIELIPSCGSVSPESGTTDADGHFRATVTPASGCTQVSVEVIARLEPEGPEIADTRRVTGTVRGGAASAVWRGTYAIDLQWDCRKDFDSDGFSRDDWRTQRWIGQAESSVEIDERYPDENGRLRVGARSMVSSTGSLLGVSHTTRLDHGERDRCELEIEHLVTLSLPQASAVLGQPWTAELTPQPDGTFLLRNLVAFQGAATETRDSTLLAAEGPECASEAFQNVIAQLTTDIYQEYPDRVFGNYTFQGVNIVLEGTHSIGTMTQESGLIESYPCPQTLTYRWDLQKDP